MKARMVLAAPPIRKLHVGGRSRRHACFSLRKHPVSPSLHRGLSPVGYDFALANGDELVSYTVAKPRKSPVRYYAHANHLYSIAATTNASGSVVERYSYNAYGVRTLKNSAGATLANSAVGNDRGFTGYKLDSETGLYFARARMYFAKLGRFISQDPNGYVDGISLYNAYFVPNALDPTGLLLCSANLYLGHSDSVSGWWKKQKKKIDKGVFKNQCSYKFGILSCSPRNANDMVDHDREHPQDSPGSDAGHGMDWGLNKDTFDKHLNKDQFLDFPKFGEAAQTALNSTLSQICSKECCTEWKIEVTCANDVGKALGMSLPANLAAAATAGLCGPSNTRTWKGKCESGKPLGIEGIQSVINALVSK